MSELQKYIDAAKQVQSKTPRTQEWYVALGAFGLLTGPEIASLMIDADAELQRLRDENLALHDANQEFSAENRLLRMAVEWLVSNSVAICMDGKFRNGNDEVIEVPPELAPYILGEKT